jgi:hypothetical protein
MLQKRFDRGVAKEPCTGVREGIRGRCERKRPYGCAVRAIGVAEGQAWREEARDRAARSTLLVTTALAAALGR